MSFTSQLSWRYATKKFNPEKPISEESLNAVLESIRMAPTSYGLQPFHVSIISNPEIKEKLKGAAWNQDQLLAPYVLLFSANSDVKNRIEDYLENMSGGDKESREKLKSFEDILNQSFSGMSEAEAAIWSAKQAYIALGFGLAACAELSIDSCPMEGFDRDAFKKILNLPENLHPAALLCIGYRAEDDKPRPKFRFSGEKLFGMIK